MKFIALIFTITTIFLVSACSSAKKGKPSISTPAAVTSPTSTGSKSTSSTKTITKTGSPEYVESKDNDSAFGAMEMVCKNENDERTLILVPRDSGCELHYHKFGRNEVKATSLVGQRYCEEVRVQMRKNLETAGFTCD